MVVNMCQFCDYENKSTEIFQDSLTGEWYLDIQTLAWDEIAKDYIHEKLYINYCPYCGRKL